MDLPPIKGPQMKDFVKRKEEVERAKGLRAAIDDPRIYGNEGETKLVKSLKDFEKIINAKAGAEDIIERINPFKNTLDDERNKETKIPGDVGQLPEDDAEDEKDESDEEPVDLTQ